MSSLFHPDVYLPSLKEIDPEKLKAAGIRLVILDNDNTIAASRGQDVSPEAEEFVKEVKAAGMDGFVLSNNFSSHARKKAEQLGLSYLGFCLKPLKHSYERAMMLKGVGSDACVMIGDQVITDICGAKRCRMHTILVDHSDRRDHIFGYVTTAACSILKLLIKDIPEKGEYYGNL